MYTNITTIEELQMETQHAYDYIKNKDYENATKILNRCISVSGDINLANSLGYAYFELGAYELATRIFEEILVTSPSYEPAIKNYAECVIKLTNVNSNKLKRAISFYPNSELLWIRLIQYYNKSSKPEKEYVAIKSAMSYMKDNRELRKR